MLVLLRFFFKNAILGVVTRLLGRALPLLLRLFRLLKP